MPSTEHDALSELFRFQPALVVALLRDLLHHPVPAHRTIEVLEGDFTQTMTTEYRADRVLVLRGARGSPKLGVIIEVQRRIDEDKRWAWPVYWTALRARLKCEAVVLVLCLDDETADWAAKPIDLGMGRRLDLEVVGPSTLPTELEASEARRLPELAVLSAMTHGNDRPDGLKTVLCAFEAATTLDEERARFYTDLVLARLNETAREELEELGAMKGYEYQSEFARKYYGQGKAEGLAKGLAEGEAKGLAEGEAKGLAEGEAKGLAEGEARGKAEGEALGKAEAVVTVLQGRGLKVTAEQRKRILACRDIARLDRWLLKALSATSTADLLPPRKPASRASAPAARKAATGKAPAARKR